MDEWNVTFEGDYLWTNMIVGEVFPTATTPSTWSVWQDYFDMLSLGDISTIEPIAGRPYLNYSLMYSFALKIMRTHERVMNMTKGSIGLPPTGIDIPRFPISWRTLLLEVLPREARNSLKKNRLRKNAPEFLAKVASQSGELRRQIESAASSDLVTLWKQELRPLWSEIHLLQDKMNEDLNLASQQLKTRLTKLVGEENANRLMTTVSSTGELASLGPLAGLSILQRGEISRTEYLQLYGHRGPHENELFEPRPYEIQGWLDDQLEKFSEAPIDITARLAARDAESAAVWGEIKLKLPAQKAELIERQINELGATNTLREATRSELTRLVGIIRCLFLRAGELTGLGDDVFFLTVVELQSVLSGNSDAVSQAPVRRQTFETYRELPSLPPWIRGRFDPFEWAADPDRPRDVFDAQISVASPVPQADVIIRGQPGSAGCVEGIVRRIDSPEEGDRLMPGEILVTSTTNIGWTPLFPRVAAVVTDVGGSLSHAAIVARELGIPAVVGCGEATTRLKTGDRVRVDGVQGTVEILNEATV